MTLQRITGAMVSDSTLTGADIQDEAMTGADIQDGSVGSSDLAASTAQLSGKACDQRSGGKVQAAPASGSRKW